MNASPDLSSFVSRLHFHGRLNFETALRIGASRSTRVDDPDLPILRDALGRPYIPGSSLKGALRSYVEAVLRTLQANPAVKERNLACLPVGKPEERPEEEAPPHVCLHNKEVSNLKKAAASGWKQLDDPHQQLAARLPALPDLQTQAAAASAEAVLDDLLRQLSCWSCRVFGAQWLAAKALVRDLTLSQDWEWPAEMRNGVAIDRDAGRAFPGHLYDLEVLPAGASFELQILVENASEAELGLLWLGLAAMQRGEILLGGARSRGLGWCRLEPNWQNSRYITQEHLVEALLGQAPPAPGDLENRSLSWIQAFGQAIGALRQD